MQGGRGLWSCRLSMVVKGCALHVYYLEWFRCRCYCAHAPCSTWVNIDGMVLQDMPLSHGDEAVPDPPPVVCAGSLVVHQPELAGDLRNCGCTVVHILQQRVATAPMV